MDAIRTVGLTKLYGGKPVVSDMNLTVDCGAIYGFVGRNGAGKSTLMKMLAGLTPPTSGEIEILGEKQAPGCTSRRLGALIESPGMYAGLSGLDNVMVRAIALGVPDAKKASLEALDIVGLSSVANKRAKSYSLGMKQRLGIALALVGSPDLLLLDEPFNGLDPQAVREVRTTIMRLAHMRSITVFVSSHVLDQLERMVTHYGVVREGRLVREMSAEEVDRECADHVCVHAADPRIALAKLQDRFPGAQFAVMENDDIHASGGISPEDIGRTLTEAGIPISKLYMHERDIEELFVELMGADFPTSSPKAATQPQASTPNEPSGFNRGGGIHA